MSWGISNCGGHSTPICFELEVHSSGLQSLRLLCEGRLSTEMDDVTFWRKTRFAPPSPSDETRIVKVRHCVATLHIAMTSMRSILWTCYLEKKKEDDDRGQTDGIQISFCCSSSLFEVPEILCGTGPTLMSIVSRAGKMLVIGADSNTTYNIPTEIDAWLRDKNL